MTSPSGGPGIAGVEYTGDGPQVGHAGPRRQQQQPLNIISVTDRVTKSVSFFIFLFSAPGR